MQKWPINNEIAWILIAGPLENQLIAVQVIYPSYLWYLPWDKEGKL